MLQYAHEIQTLDQLREYVNETLCEYAQLEPGTFRMTQQILLRSGRPCGIYFCIFGPRAVRLSAVWETDGNTILFYGSTGERFHKTQLAAAPCLELQAA